MAALPSPENGSSWHEWASERSDFEWLFPFIDRDHDGKISADEYKAFEAQAKRYLDKSWPKTNELGQTGQDIVNRRVPGRSKSCEIHRKVGTVIKICARKALGLNPHRQLSPKCRSEKSS